jgi:type I restriction enzyme S subunit
MNPAQLLAHFDQVAEAPDAIPRLRRFILDLAVRGKLMEQDPKDEPAAELLRRIQAEKARLVKEGEIRKEKPLPLIEPDHAPFDAPVNWEWVRIRQVTSDRGQTVPNNEFTYIDVTAINKEAGYVADAKRLSASDAPSRARKLVRTGDVLYSCVRPYLLNIAVVEKDITPSPIASTAFAVLNGFGLVLAKYLWIALRSPFMVQCVEAKMRGQAYPAINDSDFALLPLPLPPLAEQHRIVAKVDELMALCDRLEAAQTERESRRDRLVRASLHGLNQPGDAGDTQVFRAHARFTLDHLPRLTTCVEHIAQLRQAILNLAMRGKLVEQNPNDEPVSELLKHIHAERARLIELGKINENERIHIKAKSAPPDNSPSGWKWTRFREVIWCFRGHNPPKSDFVSSPRAGYVRFIQITDFKTDRMAVYVPMTNKLKMVYRGEIIMAAYRHIGKVSRNVEGAFNVALCKVNEILPMDRAFVELLIGTDFVRGELLRASERGHIPSMHSDHLLSLWVPIPPLAEQKRILKKHAELLALCDRLEAQLTTARTGSRRLLEAVLHEALDPTA